MRLSLEVHVLLCRLAVAVAAADPDRLRLALESCAASADVTGDDVDEAILQGIPFAGFPGAVEALGTWREIQSQSTRGHDSHGAGRRDGVPPCEPGPSDLAAGDLAAGDLAAGDLTAGAQVFEQIYEGLADRVRGELRRRHPDLEGWIIGFAYGRVMTRAHFELGTIEALGVASLLGQRRRPPLHSHLRGALRNGWSPDELCALLQELSADCSPEILEFARRIVTGPRSL